MQLVNDEGRSYIFCPNEVAAEVTAQRLRGESDNDFNDRLIRRSAAAYAELVHSRAESDKALAGCRVFLLSNDVDNRVRLPRHQIAESSLSIFTCTAPRRQ